MLMNGDFDSNEPPEIASGAVLDSLLLHTMCTSVCFLTFAM